MIALSSLSISVSHPLSLSAEPAISELVADVIKLHPYILQHMAPKSEDIRQHSPNCNYHTQKIELHLILYIIHSSHSNFPSGPNNVIYNCFLPTQDPIQITQGFFHDSDIFNTPGQLIFKTSLNFNLSDCFLIIRCKLNILGRNTT